MQIKIKIKTKLLFLAILPVSLLAVVMLLVSSKMSTELGQLLVEETQVKMLEQKKAELTAYMDIAYSAIQGIYENDGSFEQARPILKSLKYGDSGYFFAYTMKVSV